MGTMPRVCDLVWVDDLRRSSATEWTGNAPPQGTGAMELGDAQLASRHRVLEALMGAMPRVCDLV